ncbi:innexin shaking-B [Caerostris extrusa]|uniref:Innexin n=1 Tax=Caerostris extrusa TaxID=172846 RepID=A0AAV4R8T9_CAEEX|nr:innexin shaking-B [Caerostris extrusa]
MFSIVQSVGTFVKISDIKIEYDTFRLHYTFTVGLLLAFFVIITTRQFVGEPIICDYADEAISTEVISTYCWIHPTYVIPKAFFKEERSSTSWCRRNSRSKEFWFLKYYQWVYFMLFFQAVLFYIPRWLWRMWEGGKMKTLTKDLDNVLIPPDELKEKSKALTTYLVKTWTAHNSYAAKYFLCEFLALFNVIGQMFLLNKFFDGRFLKFGYDVIKFFYSAEYIASTSSVVYMKGDPMIMLFPRVTKCVFRKYGKSSLIEVHDILCVMALNIINEKIYIFLWFWFIILIVLTGLSCLVDLVLVFSPTLRVYTLKTHFYLVDKRDLQILMRKGSFGDWFIIDLLGQNLDAMLFKDVMTDIVLELTDNYKVL